MAYGQNVSMAAEFIHEFWFPVHRGCIASREHLIVFGNDGYGGEGDGARREVELVKAGLVKLGFADDKMAFGTDSNEYTWVIVVDLRPKIFERGYSAEVMADVVNSMVWDCWRTLVEKEVAA